MASDTTLVRPTSGHELAVFGRVRGAAAVFAALDSARAVCPDAAALADPALEPAGACPAAALVVASVAFTSCSVTTFGGSEVMIIALSLSPSRSSESCAGLTVLNDLHAALVHVALREALHALVGVGR